MSNKRMAPLKEVIINAARDLYNIGLMKEKDYLKIADLLTKKKEGKSTGE